jgi:hypothetical protein
MTGRVEADIAAAPQKRASTGRLTGRHARVLTASLAIATLLRFAGQGFGLPFEYHFDELQHVRKAALMGQEGLEPRLWNNPPLYKYVLLGEYAALYAAGRALGLYESTRDFGRSSNHDPTPLYRLARSTSAVAGVLTVAATAWIGRWVIGARGGLVAAWLLATCFLHVRESHYGTNDTLAALFATVAVGAAIGIRRGGGRGWPLLGGAAVGLGFATKYTALVGAVPVALAQLWMAWPRVFASEALRRAGLSLAAAVVAILAASPFFVIAAPRVLADIYEHLYMPGQSGFGGRLIDARGAALYYLHALGWGVGWLPSAAIAMGAVLAVRRRDVGLALVASLPVAFAIVMGRQELFFARFLLPALPCLILLAAAAVDALLAWLSRRGAPAWVGVLTVLGVTAQPLAASIRYDWLLLRDDTRTLAKRWFEREVPSGSRVVVEWRDYSPQLGTPERRAADGSSATYDVHSLEFDGLYRHPAGWYRDQGFDYLVATSFVYAVGRREPDEHARHEAVYAELEDTFELVKTFSPWRGPEEHWLFAEIYGPSIRLWERERPGPTLKIYRVGSGPNRNEGPDTPSGGKG